MIDLYQGDCLEVMKDIPDASVDLVLTDPPYNIGKAKWDKIKNYVEWCAAWLKECERVLKPNGSLYFWHNDMAQIAQLMEWIRHGTAFRFNSFVIWDKGEFRALSWKNPSEASTLRSWFNTCEYCLYYTFQDGTGLEKVMLDTSNFSTLRDYFKRMQEYIGLTSAAIKDKAGQSADHCFRWGSTQWDIPTPETYARLVDMFDLRKWSGFREYEALRQEYEALRQEYEALRQEYEALRYIHNLDPNHNNVWRLPSRNNGDNHPCQKPTALLERIIRTSSNPGGVVLDCFMGSGSTGVAALNLNRKFIGIELDATYCGIAKERILHIDEKHE